MPRVSLKKSGWRPLRKEKCVYFVILFRFRPNYAISCDPTAMHAFQFKGDARFVIIWLP